MTQELSSLDFVPNIFARRRAVTVWYFDAEQRRAAVRRADEAALPLASAARLGGAARLVRAGRARERNRRWASNPGLARP